MGMNANDILKYGHLTVCHTVDGLPDAKWEIDGVCGVWSVKDIIGHLAAFEHMLTDVLSTFLDGGDTPYLTQMAEQGGQAFNDIQAAARKSRSVQDVWREYNDACAESTALARRIPPETWTKVGSLPWYGAEYALDDFIVYSFYGHKREHCAQINVFRDTLKTG
jgi:hypothetical protein